MYFKYISEKEGFVIVVSVECEVFSKGLERRNPRRRDFL